MQSPLEALHDYYKTFSTLDLNTIVQHFSEPCMSIASQGVFSADNRARLADVFGPLIISLKEKSYAKSEFVNEEVTSINETTALVRGVAVRYKRDGSELERVPISYLMHQRAGTWNIATMILP